jgi:hypothetical protein
MQACRPFGKEAFSEAAVAQARGAKMLAEGQS